MLRQTELKDLATRPFSIQMFSVGAVVPPEMILNRQARH